MKIFQKPEHSLVAGRMRELGWGGPHEGLGAHSSVLISNGGYRNVLFIISNVFSCFIYFL